MTQQISFYRDGRLQMNGEVHASLAELCAALLSSTIAPDEAIVVIAEDGKDFEGIGRIIYTLGRMGLAGERLRFELDGQVAPIVPA